MQYKQPEPSKQQPVQQPAFIKYPGNSQLSNLTQPAATPVVQKQGVNGKVVLVILILQVIILGLLFWQMRTNQLPLSAQLINEVASKVTVYPHESPSIALISDANALRAADPINADVYKNAQNGDYVLGFSDKMVIYRRASGEIIYQGEAPGTLATKRQQEMAQTISTAAAAKKLLTKNSSELPRVSVIDDVSNLQKQNATFYAKLAKGDVVAEFVTNGIILIYRPDTKEIINSGSFSLNIK